MIVHGGKDYITKTSEMKKFARMIKENGVEVQFEFYEEEMRGLKKSKNRTELQEKVEEFLHNFLGGRTE